MDKGKLFGKTNIILGRVHEKVSAFHPEIPLCNTPLLPMNLAIEMYVYNAVLQGGGVHYEGKH